LPSLFHTKYAAPYFNAAPGRIAQNRQRRAAANYSAVQKKFRAAESKLNRSVYAAGQQIIPRRRKKIPHRSK